MRRVLARSATGMSTRRALIPGNSVGITRTAPTSVPSRGSVASSPVTRAAPVVSTVSWTWESSSLPIAWLSASSDRKPVSIDASSSGQANTIRRGLRPASRSAASKAAASSALAWLSV